MVTLKPRRMDGISKVRLIVAEHGGMVDTGMLVWGKWRPLVLCGFPPMAIYPGSAETWGGGAICQPFVAQLPVICFFWFMCHNVRARPQGQLRAGGVAGADCLRPRLVQLQTFVAEIDGD